MHFYRALHASRVLLKSWPGKKLPTARERKSRHPLGGTPNADVVLRPEIPGGISRCDVTANPTIVGFAESTAREARALSGHRVYAARLRCKTRLLRKMCVKCVTLDVGSVERSKVVPPKSKREHFPDKENATRANAPPPSASLALSRATVFLHALHA